MQDFWIFEYIQWYEVNRDQGQDANISSQFGETQRSQIRISSWTKFCPQNCDYINFSIMNGHKEHNLSHEDDGGCHRKRLWRSCKGAFHAFAPPQLPYYHPHPPHLLSHYHYHKNYLRHDPLQHRHHIHRHQHQLRKPPFLSGCFIIVYWVSFKAHWKILYTYLWKGWWCEDNQ